MSKSKHTPGPWKIEENENGHLEIVTGEAKLYPTEKDVDVAMVHIWEETDREEQTANAHLIASAPDLLEACKQARAEIGGLIADPTNPDWMAALTAGNPADAQCLQAAFDVLFKAIAKAEGRAP